MSAPSEIWLCPTCGTSLDISQLGFYARLTCPQCGKKSRVHTLLANFRINGVLGQGGMSVVFSASDLVLGRELAIKVLNENYRDQPERIARFENECMLMAKVRHENVVSVYSASWARGQFYIAMEKVEGRNLELIIEEHKCLLPDEALDVVQQVACGLRAAHVAGVLHRDMKPGNIIITPEGRAKVLDFGLSQEDCPGTDQEEIIWATPFYVSPETLQRKPEDVRTDIYALGMTLRCLITGVYNLPQTQFSIDELLEIKRKMPPLQETYPNLDEALCDLVDHMTAFDPAGRPISYDELLDEIAEVRRSSGKIDLNKRRRRIRRWCLGTGGVLLLGAAAAVGVAYLTPPPPAYRSISIGDSPEWAARATMQEAYRCMERRDYAAAADVFKRLSQEAQEPTLRAAALMLQSLCLLPAQQDSILSADTFKSLLSEGEFPIAPAAEPLHRALTELLRLPSDVVTRENWPAELDPLSPPLRAVVYIRAAQQHFSVGNTPASVGCLEQAGEELSRLVVTSPLEPSVSELRHHLPRTFAYVERSRARRAMESGKPREAMRILMRIDKQHFSPAEQADHDVQREYCAIAAEAFDMLARHFPKEFDGETATPDSIRRLSAKLHEGKLADELYCIALLLRGDYAQAFNANPYKDKAKSKEPFAVLMKDWQQRLGL